MRLQESRVVRVIRKQLVKRSLDLLKEVAGRPANKEGKRDYDTFWEAFGRCVPLLFSVVFSTANWNNWIETPLRGSPAGKIGKHGRNSFWKSLQPVGTIYLPVP